jgi:glycosyltransferase involved in cell wall biosynthesis
MSSISVVIPAYNAGRFLSDALQSLRLQSRLPDEVLIIDDGSKDDTLEIAHSFIGTIDGCDLSVFSQTNAGVSSARNVGISRAKGDLVAFLDADDYLEAEDLEVLAKGFTYDNTVQLVYGSAIFYDANLENQLGPTPTAKTSLPCSTRNQGDYYFLDKNKLFQALLPGCFISPSAVMVRKTKNMPLFNGRFSQGEDRLFLLNMVRSGLTVYVDRQVARIRRHDANATNTDTPLNSLPIIRGRYDLNKYLLEQVDFTLNEQDCNLLNNINMQLRALYDYSVSLTGFGNYLIFLLSNNELLTGRSLKEIVKSILRSVKCSLEFGK